MPKAIFVDVDGTLFSHDAKRVPETAVKALQYAREKDVLLFIATGRSKVILEKIPSLDTTMPFDGFVTLNGAYCYTDDRVIFKNPMHPDAVAAVIEHIARNPFPCIFNEENVQYINMINDSVREIRGNLALPLPSVRNPLQALNADIIT